jgi:precorrin-3B C17-methyltransferase
VVGYTTYIDLIKPLIKGKQVVSTTMTKEVARVESALDLALQGTPCALVSSGDPGIYAMAGLVFEMCRRKQIAIAPWLGHEEGSDEKPGVFLEVVPGIPALCAGAALLGAPLTHDFAAISLSDLLTPWEVIAKRLEAAAAADFVVVLYNPKSKRRRDQLDKARQILLNHRRPDTPVGIVTGAMRANQSVRLTTLDQLHRQPVDMQTTVFIGNSSTFIYDQFLVTPRGYANKYDLV